MRETPSLESGKEEETFSSLAVMEKAVSVGSYMEEKFLAKEVTVSAG